MSGLRQKHNVLKHKKTGLTTAERGWDAESRHFATEAAGGGADDSDRTHGSPRGTSGGPDRPSPGGGGLPRRAARAAGRAPPPAGREDSRGGPRALPAAERAARAATLETFKTSAAKAAE